MTRLILLLVCLIVAGCSSNSAVVQVGADTYSINKASMAAIFGTDGLKTSAIEEASSYCERFSASAEILSETDSARRVEILFRCNPWQ